VAKLFRVKIVEYRLADGAHRTPDGKRVGSKTPGAVRTVRESEKWYGRLPNGKRVPLSEKKELSRRMLDKLRGDAQLDRVGLHNRCDKALAEPLVNHLDDYRQHLAGKNNTPGYTARRAGEVKAVLDGCGFTMWADIDPDKIMRWLAEQRDKDAGIRAGKRGGRSGFGLSNCNHYISAVKGFTRWLSKQQPPRAPYDCLASLDKLNANTDKRVDRRALSSAEFALLVEAARISPLVYRKLSGPDRATLYTVAAYTGLRAGELASLTPGSFQLTAPPLVMVEASYSKRRKFDKVPLQTDVAALLQAYLDGKAPARRVWPGSWHERAATMIRLDLEAAGVACEDSRGRVYDFHALRHQFASNLAAAGVAPGVAKDLLRHSTIALTMDVYTHLGMDLQAEALGKLNPPPGADVKPQAQGKRA